MLYVPVVAAGAWAEMAAPVAATTDAVKVMVCEPVLSEMLRLSKVATPVVDVLTAVVPVTFPRPEALVAEMV